MPIDKDEPLSLDKLLKLIQAQQQTNDALFDLVMEIRKRQKEKDGSAVNRLVKMEIQR